MAGYFHPMVPSLPPEYVSMPTFVACKCGAHWTQDMVRDKNAQYAVNGPYVRFDYCDACKDKPSPFKVEGVTI